MKSACVGVLSIIELKNARWNIEILDRFSKNTQYKIVLKSFQWERSCFMRTDRRTDRQTWRS